MTNEQWARHIVAHLNRGGFKQQVKVEHLHEFNTFLADMLNDARRRDLEASANRALAAAIAGNGGAA